MISSSNHIFNMAGCTEATYALLNNIDQPLSSDALSRLLKDSGGPGGKPWPASLADDFVKH